MFILSFFYLVDNRLGGGVSPASFQDAEISAALKFATTSINSQMNDMFMRTPHIDNGATVTKQVTCFPMYHFYIIK